jgi:DtxR family Mn-dependent transcriptional regulator
METKTVDKLSSSMEDYLETIFNLEKANRVARVKDIAANLKVKMPSVTGALKILKERNLINYEKNSFICLTKNGLKIAKVIVNKHRTLTRFLETILIIPSERAQEMACKMEHAIDFDTTDRMKRLIDCFETKMMKSGKIKWEEWKSLMEGDTA